MSGINVSTNINAGQVAAVQAQAATLSTIDAAKAANLAQSAQVTHLLHRGAVSVADVRAYKGV